MNPLRLAAQAVQLVCDWFAPVQPVRVIVGQHAPKSWPDGEAPLIDARLFGFRDGSLAPEVWATMPQESSARSGSTASEAGVDLVAEEVPTPGRAHTPGVGHPALLRASAIQLEEWSRHIACPAAIYCGSLARQLRDMATRFDNSK